MRRVKRFIIALIIATTLFLNASLNRESASTEEADDPDEAPPYALAQTYEVPALSDASKVISEGVAEREAERQAERQRIKDEEAARIAEEKAEAQRLEAVEKERLAAIERERVASAERKRIAAVEAEKVRKAAQEVAAVTKKPAAKAPTEPSRSNTEQAGAGQSFTATFYTAFCDTGCTGVTATGLDVSNTIYTPEGLRVVAVDPSQIPLGSIVQVTLADGTVFNAEAADTGGAIKGRIVDVLVASKDEARRLGRQDIRVHIIRKGR